MSLRFKNNKIVNDIWVGQIIQPGEYFSIEWYDLYLWQNDSKVLSDIGSGDGIINDGTIDIIDVTKAINFLKDIDSTPKDSDGAPLARNKITTTGWHYQLHGVEFKTSQLDSIFSKKADGTDFSFTTIKCYDSNNIELTTQTDCDLSAVKTVIDWEPTHDYEIVGGIFKQATIPSSTVRLWVIGVPDIAEQYGGSKLFTSCVNLKHVGTEEGVKVDGRAPKYLTYSAQNHTNKLRLILTHNSGFKHEASIIFEIFKA